jgi:heme-degrading monooxygenase HmoA
MHAVVVNVTITQDPGASEAALREQVVPRVSQAPGFVAGYWTRKDTSGLSMTVWESEDAATAASEMVRSAVPEGVDVGSVEVREVVANA